MADQSPVPEEAITAAALRHAGQRGFDKATPKDHAIARDMLHAAAPAIRADAVAAERERIAALLRRVDQWYEFAWVIASLTGDGPEPVVDSFGMLSLPPEVQQEIEAEAGNA